MHTILRDGNRVHLGISTGGHYLSEDGGETFAAANKGVGAGFTPDAFPEFGQCVHKIAGHKDAPGRLYMQNHGGWAEWDGPGGRRPDIGVLRSDNHGHSWRSIAKGLPSDFGFPLVVHPHNPDALYFGTTRRPSRCIGTSLFNQSRMFGYSPCGTCSNVGSTGPFLHVRVNPRRAVGAGQ